MVENAGDGEVTEGGEVQPGQGEQQQQQPEAARRSWMDIAKSVVLQMVIFYFVTSYFRGGKTPPPPEAQGPDGQLLQSPGVNLFNKGQELVL